MLRVTSAHTGVSYETPLPSDARCVTSFSWPRIDAPYTTPSLFRSFSPIREARVERSTLPRCVRGALATDMGVSQAHHVHEPLSHPHPTCALPVHLSTVVPSPPSPYRSNFLHRPNPSSYALPTHDYHYRTPSHQPHSKPAPNHLLPILPTPPTTVPNHLCFPSNALPSLTHTHNLLPV